MKSDYPDFAESLQSFFEDYLVRERGASKHTIRAYRDTFVLLIEFINKKYNVSVDRITFKEISRESVMAFLDWLETSKGNSIRTRNHRCTIIRSFFKNMMYLDPVHMSRWKAICTIKDKKGDYGTLNYLSVDAIALILKQVETNTVRGVRDLTMLSLLYNSGARVQELINLTPKSIRKEKPYELELFGKGSKRRLVPLDGPMMQLLNRYMNEYKLNMPERESCPLFHNARGEPLTGPGVTCILSKYVDRAREKNPGIYPDHVTPHVFRHSRAMHLLAGGANLIYIRDILGHVSVQTTEVYARADSKKKREALETAYASIGISEPKVKSWEKNPKLKDYLKSLS